MDFSFWPKNLAPTFPVVGIATRLKIFADVPRVEHESCVLCGNLFVNLYGTVMCASYVLKARGVRKANALVTTTLLYLCYLFCTEDSHRNACIEYM